MRPKAIHALSGLALAFAWLALLGDPSATQRARAQPAAGGLEGTWHFAGGDEEREGIGEAIDASLSALNPVVRELVARHLRDSNNAYPTIRIALGDGEIVTSANGRTLTTPADGSPRELTTPEGRTAQVSQRIVDGDLIQTLANPRGTRTHRFHVTEGDQLLVNVRIESSHLPTAVAYELTYAR